MKKLALFLLLSLCTGAFAQNGPGLYGGGYPGAKYSGQQDMLADLLFNGGTSVTGTGAIVLQDSPTINTPNIGTNFSVNSILFGTQFTSGADYNAIYNGAGSGYAFQSGGAGDPRNYYNNTNHRFRNIDGTVNYADITSTGLSLYGATSGTLRFAVPAVAGSNVITWPAGTTDFSATGGSGQVVQQASAGAALTVGQISASNLSNGTTGTGATVLAGTPTLTGTPILAAPSATTLIVGSSTTLPTPSVVVISGNSTTLPNPGAGTILHLGGANSSGPVQTFDAFATNPTIAFRRANTSAAAPSALQSGNVVMNFGSSGYGATGYAASNRVAIRAIASENWTDAAQGMEIAFLTTPNTTTSTVEVLRIHESGGLSIGSTNDPGIGNLGILPQAFSALTACSGTIKGAIAAITDSSTATWGATITGGGANNVLGWCNGTNWTVFGA